MLKYVPIFFAFLALTGFVALFMGGMGLWATKNPQIVAFSSGRYGPWWKTSSLRALEKEMTENGASQREVKNQLYWLLRDVLYAKIHRHALRYAKIAIPVGIVGLMYTGKWIEPPTPKDCPISSETVTCDK